MRLRHAIAVAGLALLGGCAGQATARAQWKVYVATDAPIPQLGQQLLVELIDQTGKDVSPQETQLVDGSRAELWPVSFGVIPPTSGSVRLRVRLYRLDETGSDGSPQGNMLLDATATLPPVAGGVDAVAMTLKMSCFGIAADLAGHRTCDPGSGQLAPEPTLPSAGDLATLPAVGSWPSAAVVPCSSVAPTGMQCVPGGAFLLGAAQFFSGSQDPSPERLVQLHPFAVDIDEVTVQQVRSLVQSQGLLPPVTRNPDPSSAENECTYTSTAGSNEGAPANCVTWGQADQACSLMHKRLPTEAEWEYVAGNMALKTPYPWGTANDVCDYAIVAHGRALSGEDFECLSAQNSFTPGPVTGGSTNDVNLLGVRNLGGNVSEWVADVFNPYSGPCWQTGSTLLVAPQCTAAVAKTSNHSLRGGSWQVSPFLAYSYQRDSGLPGDPAGVGVGFRCAVDL